MAYVRYSAQADADLLDIAAYPVATWGDRQAIRYLGQIEDCCRLIADKPQVGRACDYLHSGLRRMESGKHVVFYVVESDGGVLIARVIHQEMLPESDDFGDLDW